MNLPEHSSFVDTALSWPILIGILLKLGLVILLIYLTVLLVRHFNHNHGTVPFNFKSWFTKKNEPVPIRVLYSFSMTPSASLYLIQVLSKLFLLSVAGNEVKVLREFAEKDIEYLTEDGIAGSHGDR